MIHNFPAILINRCHSQDYIIMFFFILSLCFVLTFQLMVIFHSQYKIKYGTVFATLYKYTLGWWSSISDSYHNIYDNGIENLQSLTSQSQQGQSQCHCYLWEKFCWCGLVPALECWPSSLFCPLVPPPALVYKDRKPGWVNSWEPYRISSFTSIPQGALYTCVHKFMIYMQWRVDSQLNPYMTCHFDKPNCFVSS